MQDHAEYLILAGAQTEVAARRAAVELEEVILEYLRAEQVNKLPGELMVFQQMVVTLKGVRDSVGAGLGSDETKEALKTRILELEAENEELLKRVRKAEYRDSFQKFTDAAVESGGKLAGPAILTGSTFFLYRFVDPGMMNSLALEFRAFRGGFEL